MANSESIDTVILPTVMLNAIIKLLSIIQVGRVVLHAKKITEGIPATFTDATAKLQTEQIRFGYLANAIRTAGYFGVVEQ